VAYCNPSPAQNSRSSLLRLLASDARVPSAGAGGTSREVQDTVSPAIYPHRHGCGYLASSVIRTLPTSTGLLRYRAIQPVSGWITRALTFIAWSAETGPTVLTLYRFAGVSPARQRDYSSPFFPFFLLLLLPVLYHALRFSFGRPARANC